MMKLIKEYRWYIGFLLILIAFALVSGFNGLYGQDSYEYLRFSRALLGFYKSGVSPGNFFWPLLYPIAGSILSFAFGPIFSLQFVSICSLIGAAIFLEKIIGLIYFSKGRSERIYVFLVFLLSPYVLRASLVVMSDMLCVFLLTGAWYFFFKYRSLPRSRHIIWFSAFAVAAVATRYAAIVVLIIPAIISVYHIVKDRRWKVAAISIIISAIIVLPHILLRHNHPFAFIKHDWITEWSFADFFKTRFDTADGIAHYSAWNIVYVFYNLGHPAFCFAGLALLVLSLKYFSKMKAEATFVAASILLYALFLAGIPLQNLRFLILSFPLVVVFFYPAFKRINDYLGSKTGESQVKIYMVYIMGALVQIGLFCRVLMPFYHDNKIEKQLAAVILQHPQIPVYTFSVDGALKAYGVHNTIINLYDVRLDTLKQSTSSRLVLFNEKQWSETWKGQNPMINWSYIKRNFKLTKEEDLPDGWELYTAF